MFTPPGKDRSAPRVPRPRWRRHIRARTAMTTGRAGRSIARRSSFNNGGTHPREANRPAPMSETKQAHRLDRGGRSRVCSQTSVAFPLRSENSGDRQVCQREYPLQKIDRCSLCRRSKGQESDSRATTRSFTNAAKALARSSGAPRKIARRMNGRDHDARPTGFRQHLASLAGDPERRSEKRLPPSPRAAPRPPARSPPVRLQASGRQAAISPRARFLVQAPFSTRGPFEVFHWRW